MDTATSYRSVSTVKFSSSPANSYIRNINNERPPTSRVQEETLSTKSRSEDEAHWAMQHYILRARGDHHDLLGHLN